MLIDAFEKIRFGTKNERTLV